MLQTTKRYELLNYGEYGTVVDNVLYSCNYTRIFEEQIKEEKTEKATYINKEEETSDILKDILHKQEISCVKEYAEKSDNILCKCNQKCERGIREHIKEGWEGSAVIAHGSIISFGCLIFVFNTLNAYVDR